MDIQKARILAIKKMPYMASAIYALRYYDSPKFIGIACVTNNGVLVYNSKINDITEEEFSTVILHETLHLIQNHYKRGSELVNQLPSFLIGSAPKLKNIFMDFEINDDLESIGCKFPEKYKLMFPQDYGYNKFRLFEEYWAEYLKFINKNMKNRCSKCGQSKGCSGGQKSKKNNQGSNGQNSPGSNGQNSQDPNNQNSQGSNSQNSQGSNGQNSQGANSQNNSQTAKKHKKGYCPDCGQKLNKKDISNISDPKCGSAAGNPHEIEKDIKDKGHINKTQLQRIRKEVAELAKEHEKKIGSIPLGMKILIEEVLATKPIDWRRQLAKYIRKEVELVRGLVNPTYSRLSRRQYNKDIIFPSYVAPKPKVGVLIDTSGSMSQEELAMGLFQIDKVLKNICSEVSVVVVDCVVNEVYQARKIKDIQSKMSGGGGTDFREAIPILDEKGCDCVIGISDCCAVFPKDPPKASYIWVSSYKEQPPFGKFILMEKKGERV